VEFFIKERKFMSRKKLLTEGEIRQFMKLANLRPIGDQRLHEMYPGQRDEEPVAPEGDEEAGMEPMDFGDEGGEDLEDEAALEDEAGLEAEEGGGEMVSVDDFMSALETALEDVMGEPTSVEMDTGEDEELGDEGDMDMGAEADPAGEVPMEMPGAEGGEEEAMMESADDIVNEVVRRVTRRLSADSQKEKVAEQLAERIFSRITSK
jgi:hypothetical protein